VTTLYVASPLGFSEAGRFFSRERLLPLLTRLGFEILEPWALIDPAAIERVRSLEQVERAPVRRRAAALQKAGARQEQRAVHTDVTFLALAATARIQASVSSSCISARVPKPPGTTSRSMGGVSAKANCGSTRSPPVVATGADDLATVKT